MWVGCFHCETCTWWLSLLSAVAAPQSCSGRTASAARSASIGPQWRRQEREAPLRLLRGLRASSTESWPNPGGRAARISPTSTILPPIPVPWTPPSSRTRPRVHSSCSSSSARDPGVPGVRSRSLGGPLSSARVWSEFQRPMESPVHRKPPSQPRLPDVSLSWTPQTGRSHRHCQRRSLRFQKKVGTPVQLHHFIKTVQSLCFCVTSQIWCLKKEIKSFKIHSNINQYMTINTINKSIVRVKRAKC